MILSLPKMRVLLGLTSALICLAILPIQANAAKLVKSPKAVVASKEKLVLMPMHVSEEDKALQGTLENALVEGLQRKYDVLSGEKVSRKAREIFQKESSNKAKKECDETKCMVDIALAFQAELIATATVTKKDDGYLLTLSIRNILDDTVVLSKTATCEYCKIFTVVDKLKELSGAAPVQQQAATFVDEPTVVGNLNDPEVAFWNEIKSSTFVDDFKSYLAQYPKGKFAVLARNRMKKVQEDAKNDTARKEQDAWLKAEQTGGEDDYQVYLAEYPQGK